MAEEQQVIKVSINKQSIFKFKDFYDFYYNLVTSLGFDIFEDTFFRKGDNTAFEWTCTKDVDDYTKYKIWSKCKVLKAKTVKVKREGIPETMEKADVSVVAKGKIVTDWQNRWGANPLTKFLKGLFDKYLLKSTFDSRKKEIIGIVNLIENELKSFFDLPRFMQCNKFFNNQEGGFTPFLIPLVLMLSFLINKVLSFNL